MPFGLNLTLTAPIPLSAIIFSGNSTRMDLGSTGTSFRNQTPESETLYRVLLCDPQYKTQRANVTLSNGQLSASILPDLPLIGNFPEAAATALFFQAFLGVFGPQEEDTSHFLDPISMFIFTGEFNETDPQPPLSLPVINTNMNRALKSAAKTSLSGYYIPDGSPVPEYSLWNQTATVQYHQLVFVVSRPFFIGLLALVAVAVVILMVLLKVIDLGKVQLFNLQTLEKIYTGAFVFTTSIFT